MKTNPITYKNFIQKKHISKKLHIKLNKKFPHVLKKIIQNLNLSHDPLFTLSNKFKLNFKKKIFIRQTDYKTIVIIGMGGSILGSEAMYYFLKNKIKKNFIFLNDIDEGKLKELKNGINFKNTLFIVISKSGNTIETLSNLLALRIIK